MVSEIENSKLNSVLADAEPAWEIARLFPAQGSWSQQEYLELKGNRLVEFTDGWIEVLAMPTMAHQLIVAFLYRALTDFISPNKLGSALFAPFRVRLRDAKYREPDVMFMLAEHGNRMHEEFWEGADLVMEVVSEDDRRRDLETKRGEYARAGLPEYWIVDPQQGEITVLALDGENYIEHARFPRGKRAASRLLPGFEIEVTAALAVK